jgi:cell division protein FtsN
MTEQYKAPDDEAAGEEDPRKQLWIRAGVAVGLISLLLGGLAVFDHLSRPPQPEEIVAPTKPIAPAQVATDAGRDAPPEVLRAGSQGPDAAPAEALPSAEGTAPTGAPRLDKEEHATRPARGGGPVEETRPLPRAPEPPPAARVPSAALPEVASKPVPRAGEMLPAVPTGRAAPAAVAAQPVAPAVPTPSAPVVLATAPAITKAPVVPPSSPSSTAGEAQVAYKLQVGGFSTLAQAEALQARLSAEGIVSRLETRVVVGPFADRGAALATQGRLREKGFVAGELIPFRR